MEIEQQIYSVFSSVGGLLLLGIPRKISEMDLIFHIWLEILRSNTLIQSFEVCVVRYYQNFLSQIFIGFECYFCNYLSYFFGRDIEIAKQLCIWCSQVNYFFISNELINIYPKKYCYKAALNQELTFSTNIWNSVELSCFLHRIPCNSYISWNGPSKHCGP